jgi:hypothetical protein
LSIDTSYIIPFSIATLAEIAIDENELEKAKQYHEKIKTYSKYDWEKLVTVRVYVNNQGNNNTNNNNNNK